MELFLRVILCLMIKRRVLLLMRALLVLQCALGHTLRQTSQEVMHCLGRCLGGPHGGVLRSSTLVLGLLSGRIWVDGRISVKRILNSQLHGSLCFQDLFSEMAYLLQLG